MKKLAERVQKAVRERIEITKYNPAWPELFRQEAERLRCFLPAASVRRIEHFGSTAVPGLASKPIIDILTEVSSLRVARKEIAPLLKAEGYEYFWRPTFETTSRRGIPSSFGGTRTALELITFTWSLGILFLRNIGSVYYFAIISSPIG